MTLYMGNRGCFTIQVELLFMQEILHHLECINLLKNGINYQPQLVQDFFHQQYGPLLITGRFPKNQLWGETTP